MQCLILVRPNGFSGVLNSSRPGLSFKSREGRKPGLAAVCAEFNNAPGNRAVQLLCKNDKPAGPSARPRPGWLLRGGISVPSKLRADPGSWVALMEGSAGGFAPRPPRSYACPSGKLYWGTSRPPAPPSRRLGAAYSYQSRRPARCAGRSIHAHRQLKGICKKPPVGVR